MSKTIPDWVKPGTEMITDNDWPSVVKIAKVYKNGNFVTEKGGQQFMPWENGTASATGGRYYSARLTLATPGGLKLMELVQNRRVMANRITAHNIRNYGLASADQAKLDRIARALDAFDEIMREGA